MGGIQHWPTVLLVTSPHLAVRRFPSRRDSTAMLRVSNVTGRNRLEKNRVVSATVREAGLAYRIDAAPEASTTTFAENISVNYLRSSLHQSVASRENDLR